VTNGPELSGGGASAFIDGHLPEFRQYSIRIRFCLYGIDTRRGFNFNSYRVSSRESKQWARHRYLFITAGHNIFAELLVEYKHSKRIAKQHDKT